MNAIFYCSTRPVETSKHLWYTRSGTKSMYTPHANPDVNPGDMIPHQNKHNPPGGRGRLPPLMRPQITHDLFRDWSSTRQSDVLLVMDVALELGSFLNAVSKSSVQIENSR